MPDAGAEARRVVPDITAIVLGLIDHYGLLAVFVFLVLDAAMLLPIVPGEILMILAATRFADDYWSLGFVVLVATVAATVGSWLVFLVAHSGGRRFVMKHPRIFLMSPETRDKMERWFQRPSGQSLVLLLRLFPLARLLVNIPAGLARMPTFRFLVLTFIGNLLFHAGLMYLAFESQQPGSAVATQAALLQNEYANPAWTYVNTNLVLVAAVGVALGLVLSVRASTRKTKTPHKNVSGSLLGTLATATLFWGGGAILVGLWVDSLLIFDLFARTGYDLRTIPLPVQHPYAPYGAAAAVGGTAMLLGLIVSSIRIRAKRRVKAARQVAAADFRAQVAMRNQLPRGPSSGASHHVPRQRR